MSSFVPQTETAFGPAPIAAVKLDHGATIAQGTPMPNTTQDEYSSQQMFRWSLFAQKTVTKGFCIKGLVGKDHFRTVDAGGGVTNEELLRGNGNWHYNLRFMYQF